MREVINHWNWNIDCCVIDWLGEYSESSCTRWGIRMRVTHDTLNAQYSYFWLFQRDSSVVALSVIFNLSSIGYLVGVHM
jgi:hypothetical protein